MVEFPLEVPTEIIASLMDKHGFEVTDLDAINGHVSFKWRGQDFFFDVALTEGVGVLVIEGVENE